MKIGVDLRVLQVGHQYRGIGEVAKQCLNRIFELALQDPTKPSFVFFEYEYEVDPETFLDIPDGVTYRRQLVGRRPRPDLPRSFLQKLQEKWQKLYGQPLPGAHACDVLLQFQYDLGVPRRPKTVLIAHDLIPYIFWDEYFISPWVPFSHHAARSTIRTAYNNFEFVRVMKRAHRNAARIICVSESTGHDLEHYLHIPKRKLRVAHLGVSLKPVRTGVARHQANFPTKPFLLFVGALDPRRRRVDDLIAAFNNLKAAGHDIQLVLAGENFQSPDSIPVEIVRKAVQDSSYGKDILTLGYIDDETKQLLYKQAIAFVFPTTYEGFGIPILESMLLGCPVISYTNSSIPEVGDNYALYAHNWEDIQSQARNLLTLAPEKRKALIDAARKHAERFSWDDTAQSIYDAVIHIRR